MSIRARKLGFWSAVLSALFSITWFVTFILQDTLQKMPDWHNLEAYAEAFSTLRILYTYPSLLLAITYLILVVCIHASSREELKIWTLISLSIGIVYATIASINYNIQTVAVRQSLYYGEISGLELWIPDNAHSIFNALANSYVYMAISMFFLGFVFQGGKLSQWIKGLLLLQAISAIGQIGWSMFDLSEGFFLTTSIVWIIGAPVVFILLAIYFRSSGD